MQWFTNLRLRAKLMVSITGVVVLTALLGLFAVSRLSLVSEHASVIAEVWGHKSQLAGEMNTATADYRISELQYALATNDAERARFDQAAKAEFEAVNKALAAYSPLATDKAEQALRDQFVVDWTAYKDEHYKLTILAQVGKLDGVRSWAEGPSKDVYKRYSNALDKIVAFNAQGARAASQESQAMYQQSRWAVLAGVALVAALGFGIAMVVSQQIAAPLAGAVEVLQAVADGDLTHQVRTDRSDEVGDIQHALAGMQHKLSDLVQQVRHGADSVATASTQIAQGNADLSARTETQASSLQQTAASVEQMAGTVRTNAGNAQQANQLATAASDAATKGGRVVSEVVDTMNGIQASSRKIADIIGVIDGIAFQTNILALNAAVEAARAGEQGRGFAVVAGEVRTLAQRSANAAREIKTLIHDSVEKVNAGTQLVGAAGHAIDDVVLQVRKVTDLVGEIAHASAEQSQGIGQINQAVGQLDQTTQQNAALVEQSMAAAESLKIQAARLADSMSAFKVQGGAGQGGDVSMVARSAASSPHVSTASAALRSSHSSSATASYQPAASKVPTAKPVSITPVTPLQPSRPVSRVTPFQQRSEPTMGTHAATPPSVPRLPAPSPAPTTVSTADDSDWETF
jgi:methyl-accepting chemotaxis protein